MVTLLALVAPAQAADASFGMGTVDLKVKTAFHGTSPSPVSLIFAFLGWNEIGVSGEVGALKVGDLSLGVGAEAYYARPWFAELLFEGIINSADPGEGRFDYGLWEAGVLGRGALHFGPDLLGVETLDPYVVALAGPTMYRFKVAYTSPDGSAEFAERLTGVRLGAGVGANVVAGGGFLGSLELRYLYGTAFGRTSSISLEDGDTTLIDYEVSAYQRPPRGFSWTLSVGYRFF